MPNFTFNIDDIHAIIDKISQSNLDGFELKTQDFKLKLSKNKIATPTTHEQQLILTRTTDATPTVQTIDCEPPKPTGNIVTSPIVGTFYSAASPDKPAFVQVGDTVTPCSVLFIIESMKLMNEITCEFSGKVAEILVENGQPVEFGQPIMRIE